MARKLIGFKADETLHRRVERHAKSVPDRTVSAWLRDVVERALKAEKAK